MLQLNVKLDDSLCESLAVTAEQAGANRSLFKAGLTTLVNTEDVFVSERQNILQDIESWFDIDNMIASPTFWDEMKQIRSYLLEQATKSVNDLTRFVGALQGARSLSVYLVPGFAPCYGPRDGLQIFALRSGANPQEALLFLTHVYYHDLSSLFYSQASAKAAQDCESAALLKHLIRLLIQNEGLANFVVLDPLLALRSQGSRLLYFTYADLIGEEESTIRAMQLCRKILTGIGDQNFHNLRSRLSEVFKNPALPMINLIGIHLAQAIARKFGTSRLFETAQRDPQDFFRLYRETDDSLSDYLFGTNGEANSVFC